jgi:hypothetical protein
MRQRRIYRFLRAATKSTCLLHDGDGPRYGTAAVVLQHPQRLGAGRQITAGDIRSGVTVT